MKNLISNTGQSIVLADANWFTAGDRTYWWDLQGTKFIGSDIYNACKSISTSPIGLGYLNQALTDPTIAERFNNEWYWVVGDIVHGGLAFFYYDSTSYYIAMIKIILDAEGNPSSITYQATPFSKTSDFYIIDKMYVAGDTENYGSCFFISDGDGKFTLGYYQVIPPVPPVVVWTVSAVEQPLNTYLPTGDSYPPTIPHSLRAFQGSNNGVSIRPDGETLFSITLQAWTKATTRAYFDCWDNLDNANLAPPDPNQDGGYSTTGGGDGSPQSSVDIDFPELPPDMLLNSGIIKMYSPSSNDMDSFVQYIYSAADSVILNFKKLWANPFDSIISFGVVPFDLTFLKDNAEEVKFCGVGSGVYMPPLKSQYTTVDCGDLDIVGEYGSLLDYNSYTRIKLFLPFIGFVDLNTDDVMDATVHIKYYIDLMTGDCLAIVKSTKTVQEFNVEFSSCIYQFRGNILSQAPLTGTNYQQLYSGIANLVEAVALPTPASVAGVADQIMGQKVQVQRSGVVAGNVGTLGEYNPYILIEKPIRSIPIDNDTINGYPSNITATLSQKNIRNSGYTVMKRDQIIMDEVIGPTEAEKQMIKDILETGIFLNYTG